jgi:hypothetical protein
MSYRATKSAATSRVRRWAAGSAGSIHRKSPYVRTTSGRWFAKCSGASGPFAEG